jgi:hypothetical protein
MNGCHLDRSQKTTLVSFMEATSAGSMTLLLEFGIDIAKFQSMGDFGPGFYCADKVQTTLRVASLSSFEEATLAYVAPGGGDMAHQCEPL